MESNEINIFAVDAVIIILNRQMTDYEKIQNWMEKGTKQAIIYPDNDRKKIITGIEGFKNLVNHELSIPDINGQERTPSSHLKSAMDTLNSNAGKTVLITFDPEYVKAAVNKRMGMVIGITNNQLSKRIFYDSGAHLVADDLDKVAIQNGSSSKILFTQSLPDLFSRMTKFHLNFGERKPVFFFDYDGTLTPIVKDPAAATINGEMRDLLFDLSKSFPVAVVSGRDINDIRNFVDLDTVIYAGSHGFRIDGPDGLNMVHPQAGNLVKGLDEIENYLRRILEFELEGVQVERKQFAIAVHYRNARPGTFKHIRRVINDKLADYDDFKKGGGKKIIEVKPALDWHKGAAVEWIMNRLQNIYAEDFIPVYIGDDLTDENAFRSLADEGITILVGDHSQPSAAQYHLRDVSQVKQFLHFLVRSQYLRPVKEA